ncbi:aromatic acid exporter family protein [Skeletonema marinoi]|uniref:Aromatic acid exporter family protein n=1 Tax=Skeletonema marinoi TaxID=267567 RepID=A0AAD8Y5L0_9STRA|nr:aromatic acid exporter family protein [Skeletonema marinoi]
MSDDHEPRRRWNRRNSDGAAWGGENSTNNNNTDDHRTRSYYREPVQISAEFRERIAAAARASIVTLTTFSLLVFSGQEVLPVAWIGNVFAISVLKPTLGATFLSARDVFVPMIPVALISWAVSAALSFSSTEVYRIVLPFVVALFAMVVFLCPWPHLTMKNLMLLIFYLVVSNPLSLKNVATEDVSSSIQDIGPFFVPALVGTICIGLLVSLLVHVVMMKFARSTTASRQVLILMRQVSHETNQLLLSLTRYMQSIGKDSDVARQARTLIDYHTRRRSRIIKRLGDYLPAMRTESRLGLSNEGIDIDAIEAFAACAKKQQKHAELVQAATTQTLLGEDYTSKNSHVREVKEIISENLGYVLERLALEYSKSETVFFFVNASKEDKEQIIHDLQHSMDEYLQAMRQAIHDAEALLQNNDDASRSTAGPMIRVRVTFLALFSFIHELRDVVSATKATKDKSDKVAETAIARLLSCLKMKWLWKDISKRRLATKTAVGLSLASLWVSIPYLNGHLAYTQGVWVGVTVASISLETTGAAYTKALDRLWGTLIAAAYSLFVDKVFHVNAIAKLLTLTLITFISILVSNPNRPYASRYAATSVGSILYGSFDNKMLVDDYVPTRIMLIFVGVTIFLFVELLMFPRSSRTIVQAQTVQLFEDLEQFFYQSSKSCSAISSVSGKDEESNDNFVDPLWMLRHGHKEVDVTSSLRDSVSAVKKTFALAKVEMRPGTLEPSLGMNISLDDVGYDRLLSESENMIVQIDLLVVTLQSLRGYYCQISKEHPVRDLQWPSLVSASLLRIAQQLSEISDEFRLVFPHGLFRPGASNITSIIGAVSLFRRFAQVRLSILADVEDRHASYLDLDDIALSGEGARHTPGFRLTLALAVSAMLGVAQGLQNCGRHLERIVESSFPLEEVKCNENYDHTTAIQFGGSGDSNDS